MPRNGDPSRSTAGERFTELIKPKPSPCNRPPIPPARTAFLRMQCDVTVVQEPRQRRPPTPRALRPTAPGWPRDEAYPGSPRPVESQPQRGCGPARIWRLEPSFHFYLTRSSRSRPRRRRSQPQRFRDTAHTPIGGIGWNAHARFAQDAKTQRGKAPDRTSQPAPQRVSPSRL
jgi:hypothetical protein